MGDLRYIQLPGFRTHELPPLLVRCAPETAPLDHVLDVAAEIVETEEMLSHAVDERLLEQRKFDLAVNLTQQYMDLVSHWQWGDSILEWIRQCEITFEAEDTLRQLLHPDVWPHAGRASFVTLLADKAVGKAGDLEQCVGLRLTFRQPPPIDCFSNQFLFLLQTPMADTVYHTWAALPSQMPCLLPPERFHFEVLDLGQQ